ncbi:MAG: hypothetical protein ACYDGR_10405 [Candidatus Dormibacteria bacterium]
MANPVIGAAGWQVVIVSLFLLSSVLILLIMGILNPGSSPHHSLLAYSFTHHRLDVPLVLADTARYRGFAYLPYGPFPAILFVPFVAILGPLVPNIVLAIPVGLATLPALDHLWRQLGWTHPVDRRWLTLMTLGGTVWLSALVANSSYYLNHLIVFCALAWALTLALQGRYPVVAGCLLAAGILTRSSTVLAWIPISLLYWIGSEGRGDRAKNVVKLTLLVTVAGVILLAYNWARFGNALESGYQLQQLDFRPLADARAHGLFSIAHIPKNLYYLLIAGPVPVGGQNAAILRFPWVEPSPWGMGLLWVSPLILFGAMARGRLALIMCTGAVGLLIPDLLYYGIGWIQFGYRYSIDALPFAAALAALALRQRAHVRYLPFMVTYSVVVNVVGAAWLIRTVN